MAGHAAHEVRAVLAAAARGGAAAGAEDAAHTLDHGGDAVLGPPAVVHEVAQGAPEDGAAGVVLRQLRRAPAHGAHGAARLVAALDAARRDQEAPHDERGAPYNRRLPR